MTTLAPFVLHRAGSVADATSLLAEFGDDAVIYSGGTELLLLMKLGFASYGHLVDIKHIDELVQLKVGEDVLIIGGAVTHRAVEQSAMVRSGWPDLVAMERRVANVRVRSTGTLGGNLAFADPHSDPATFLLAAGASVTLGRGERRRRLGLNEYVLGPYETALEPDELLCTIEVPAMPRGAAMSHLRFASHERPAATVTAWVQTSGDGIVDARVAVGSVGATPVLVPGAADLLRGQDPRGIDPRALAALGAAGADTSEPVTDSNGSDVYKHSLVATLVGRALIEAGAMASMREEIST